MYRSVRLASSLVAALPAGRRVLARRGWVGEMSGLVPDAQINEILACPPSFSAVC